MKKAILILIGSMTAIIAVAQHSKMEVFIGWHGHWQGEGWMQMGPEKKKSTVDEFIEPKLDGTILTLEGIGKSIDEQSGSETKVHHAFGILSFDQTTNDYTLRTYLVDGRSTDAWFKILNETNFQWGFEVANRKFRYSITLDSEKGTWSEIGEYSLTDNSWNKFFQMNLKKVK